MDITFKELLEEVYQVLPSTGEKGIAPIAVYDGLNAAINELSAESGIKNLMPERTEYIEIDMNNEYHLSGLDYQHIKTEQIRNESGNKCDRKSREFLKTICSAGEKKYAQEGEIITVKPKVASEKYTITINATAKTVLLADYAVNEWDVLLTAGMKFYLSGCANSANDTIYTIKTKALQGTPNGVRPLLITINDDEQFAGGNETATEDVIFGLVYTIVYRHALPTFSSFAGTSTITIDEYFVPAIVHLAIANIAQAKDYGAESAISERYFAIYENDVKGLIVTLEKQKQVQL